MSTSRSELGDSVSNLLRVTAKEYGEAITEYGNALVAYGKGEINANKVAETALKVASREARRALDTSVGLGGAYAKWAASLVGLKLKKATPEASDSKGEAASGQ